VSTDMLRRLTNCRIIIIIIIIIIRPRAVAVAASNNIQESSAIAKMAARCARYYMDALKIFGSTWLRPRLLLPKLLIGFCCDQSYEIAFKI